MYVKHRAVLVNQFSMVWYQNYTITFGCRSPNEVKICSQFLIDISTIGIQKSHVYAPSRHCNVVGLCSVCQLDIVFVRTERCVKAGKPCRLSNDVTRSTADKQQ